MTTAFPLKRKLSKASVRFEHPAHGKDKCKDCVHFHRPLYCGIVAGIIRPTDWCMEFKAKKSLRQEEPPAAA